MMRQVSLPEEKPRPVFCGTTIFEAHDDSASLMTGTRDLASGETRGELGRIADTPMF